MANSGPPALPSDTRASIPVPMLDVSRQNRVLRAEIDAAIGEVSQAGAFVHGPACREFEADIAAYCGADHAVGCASGSDALLLALMVLGVGPGDEVVLPSFTFFATASAVSRLGARPVFADILPENFNVDPADVARKITPATKAILPVHLFGQCADMRALADVAKSAGSIPLIEDAAQAIGADFHGRKAGSLATMGCFSFYPTKNLGGFGDGGMITTSDAAIAAKLRVLRDHGQQPRYTHAVVGINSRLDTIQAAVLKVKLPCLDQWAASRQRNAERYAAEVTRLGLDKRLGVPEVATGCRSVWNQYTVRATDGRRDQLQQHLSNQRVGSAIYYPIPLHLQNCFADLGYRRGSLPVTGQAAEEVLSLPIFAELTRQEQQRVIESLATFYGVASTPDENQQAA